MVSSLLKLESSSFLYESYLGCRFLCWSELTLSDELLQVRIFESHCGSLTQYGMKHMRAFANICNSGTPAIAVKQASISACGSYNSARWSPLVQGYSAWWSSTGYGKQCVKDYYCLPCLVCPGPTYMDVCIIRMCISVCRTSSSVKHCKTYLIVPVP